MHGNRGHYCWVCRRCRPNERFSGKGHARHICRDCRRRPQSEIEQLRLIDDISGFLRQSVTSEKNIKQLIPLSDDIRPEIQCRAKVMLEVARFRPGKRRRLKLLACQRPELLQELIRLFDLPDYYYDSKDMLDTFFEEEEFYGMNCESAMDFEQQQGSYEATDEIRSELPDLK